MTTGDSNVISKGMQH